MRNRPRRLDQALVDCNLAPTRSQARAMVMAGKVRVAGAVATKAGMAVREGAEVEVVAAPQFVSRGGEKLTEAIRVSRIDPSGRVCLDIGASTGGFTDCLLQHDATCVVAVDVGYGQLDWRLRNDDRVVVRERTNARNLTVGDLPPDLPAPPDLLVLDVSFIGIGKVLPAVSALCADRSDALLLVKPQFESGPGQVEAGGLVRSAAVRRGALRSVTGSATAAGWAVVAAIPSPLRGAAGNWECFLQLTRPPPHAATHAAPHTASHAAPHTASQTAPHTASQAAPLTDILLGIEIPDDRSTPQEADEPHKNKGRQE